MLFRSLPVSATLTTVLTIQSDADFVLLGIQARASDPANPVTVMTDPAVLIQLVNTGNQQLSSRAIPLGAFCSMTGIASGGVAGIGGALPVPYVFKAGGTLGTTLVNLSAAVPYDIRISYIGMKVYGFAWNV